MANLAGAQSAINAGRTALVGTAQSQSVPSLQQLSTHHVHTSQTAFRADPAMEPEMSEEHKAALRSIKPQVAVLPCDVKMIVAWIGLLVYSFL